MPDYRYRRSTGSSSRCSELIATQHEQQDSEILMDTAPDDLPDIHQGIKHGHDVSVPKLQQMLTWSARFFSSAPEPEIGKVSAKTKSFVHRTGE